ncbi:uncharacterized protein LOC133342684 [Lethenteron reissneri]|uniref:uncharacterized protein LOC133342684 n=1 Tax=Lethenteron reissneri TaxID=7753 RepID=UPI002AB69B9F|nr:uncharacterized protein LOC133342684 [Lethenteron reissneri]
MSFPPRSSSTTSAGGPSLARRRLFVPLPCVIPPGRVASVRRRLLFGGADETTQQQQLQQQQQRARCLLSVRHELAQKLRDDAAAARARWGFDFAAGRPCERAEEGDDDEEEEGAGEKAAGAAWRWEEVDAVRVPNFYRPAAVARDGDGCDCDVVRDGGDDGEHAVDDDDDDAENNSNSGNTEITGPAGESLASRSSFRPIAEVTPPAFNSAHRKRPATRIADYFVKTKRAHREASDKRGGRADEQQSLLPQTSAMLTDLTF